VKNFIAIYTIILVFFVLRSPIFFRIAGNFFGQTDEEIFEKCDANNDGFITIAELNQNSKCMENCYKTIGAINIICRRMKTPGDKYYEYLPDPEKTNWFFKRSVNFTDDFTNNDTLNINEL
jgi:hypothetical protein